MTTFYRREHKYSNVRETTLFMARVRETATFAGRTYLVIEEIKGDVGTVQTVGTTYFDDWEPATAEEWEKAVAKATRAEEKRESERQARRDGELFGFEAKVTGRYAPDGTVHIVRSTATMLVDNDGRQYSRKDGRERGTPRFQSRHLASADRSRIEAFLDGRQRVDIVAERRAATE